ncbi:MAG: hypothetical protein ACYTGN_14230 [Planctomycetota bacterium]|jgi:hypothetical protein
MTTRTLILLALVALPAAARPPTVTTILRMDELEVKLADLHDQLKAEEEFKNKPREERMILRFEQGAKTFEGKKLTGEMVCTAVLKDWKAVQKALAELTPAEAEILALLPGALGKRYKAPPIPKKERFAASKVLVKLLTAKQDTIRKAAIDSLFAIYDKSLLYKHDLPPAARRERQSKWSNEIKKLRR